MVMSTDSVKYVFDPEVSMQEAYWTYGLAQYAAEGLFGPSLPIEASSEVAVAVMRIFTGLLTREFGENAFTVGRCEAEPAAEAEAAVGGES